MWGNSFKLKNCTQISIRSHSLWCAHSSRLKPQKSLAKGWLLFFWSVGCVANMSLVFNPPWYCLLRIAPDRTFQITWEGAWSDEHVWIGDSSWNSVLPGHSIFHLVYSLGLERFEGSIWIFLLFFIWFEYHMFRWHLEVFPVLTHSDFRRDSANKK